MAVVKPEFISREINIHDLLPLSFLKMSAYTGSKRGMRYKLEKTQVEVEPEPPAAEEAAAEEKSEGAENGKTSVEAAAPEEKPKEMKTVLRCYVWYGKFAFDHTPPEEMQYEDVEFSKAGIEDAITYLNRRLNEYENAPSAEKTE